MKYSFSTTRPQELVEASTDVCVSVCQKIGASDRTLCLPHGYRKQLKDSCLKCLVSAISTYIYESVVFGCTMLTVLFVVLICCRRCGCYCHLYLARNKYRL